MRLLALLFFGLFSFAVSTVHARDFKAGGLDITDPWSRANPEGSERCWRIHEDQERRIDARPADRWLIRFRIQIRGS